MQTECPHCHTLFRITATQLEMADGQVRCGICKEVFDARLADRVHADADTPGANADLHDAGTQAVASELAPGRAPDAEPFPAHRTGPYSTTATVAWSAAILALIALLAAEYVWFNEPELLQRPGLKPVIAKLCRFTDCEHLQKRDPSLIEMVSRNVYSHPNRNDALMVSTTLVNEAPYAQPYPDVQIDFSNVRGKLIASRRFRPHEYMQLEESDIGLLETGKTIAFALEIRDPGREAITYEFSFH